VDGACCYIVADEEGKLCVVIDPWPELAPMLARWIRCRRFRLSAVVATHSTPHRQTSARELLIAVGEAVDADDANRQRDVVGWPVAGPPGLQLGRFRLTRLPVPGRTNDLTAYLLHDRQQVRAVFVGDTLAPGAPGRAEISQGNATQVRASLAALEAAAGPDALLLPAHDHEDRFATTCRIEAGRADGSAPQQVELSPASLMDVLRAGIRPLLVDVREEYETRVTPPLHIDARSVPVSALINELPTLASLPAHERVVFLCRSGNRSAQAARALRRLGHEQSWSLAGGLAMLPPSLAPGAVASV
jgi:cysteine desulfurase